MQEKELFEDYEMRNWDITTRIYKILGVATVINFLILFMFGQFNLLNTRGCDTPYVGIVCQVLDSAYIASTFLGKDNGWESRPYNANEIEDAEITYIDVSDPLKYPEGYFALANPEQMTENLPPTDITNLNLDNPTATLPVTNEDLMTKPQVIPTPNDKVGNQDVPDSPFSFGNEPSKPYKTPKIAKTKTPKPVKNNPLMSNDSPQTLTGGGNTVAKATPKPTPSPTATPSANDAKAEFTQKFNKEPLQKFTDGVIAKVDSIKPEEKVDLTQSFTVVLDGVLTKDGKFDTKKTRFVKGEGDQKMVDVAKSAIEAMGDSTLFSYLQALGVDKVNITLIQDDKQISAVIRSTQPNEEKARTVSSGFNGLILLAKINTKDDAEVQTLLKGVKFTAEGKSFVINFALPKDQAHLLIDKKLGEARQKKSQTKSEGNKPETEKGK